ncbi:hypothetical protein BDY17DRAFT_322384 [Neohortaea acidophila]|uniref:Uncharacterized protein n=1 Tax=Neohortaea acidophila TaxID=245834 RepID=A0A6A6Q0J6_9PEZI|nr:uncharacterized protein BDY17DRAFT_322384 [Neohortaea acidophila]KAF2485551.1 hypothetical protein BDY17DRAFT_322384 [Neohortaea acidophila]
MAPSVERKELKAEWKNEVKVKTYKLDDVATHNTKGDTWIVIHGHVYDVSDYVRDHPGGADTLSGVAGKDATSDYEDVGHSNDADEIMHAFLVGVIEGNTEEEGGASKSDEAVPETTVVVRRGPEDMRPKSSTAQKGLGLKTELGLFAAGTVSLVWALNHFHVLPRLSAQLPQLKLSARGSFTHGFLTASIVSGIVGIVGAQYLSSAISFGEGFEKYQPRKPAVSPTKDYKKGVLTPNEYQPYALVQKEELADGIFRFVFALPSKYSILGLPIGQHIAIRGEVDGKTITRSYTPVSNNRDLGRMELLIRIYPDGQMGKYLSSLSVGDRVDIRGPKGAMKYRKDLARHIGMVGGGTGITPLFQLVRAICEDANDKTKITLVYGNRTEKDILMRKRLDAFAAQSNGQFEVHYILDHPSDGWQGRSGYVTKDLLDEVMPKPSKDSRVLLCGPPGMVNATKKSLEELGFEAPGAVSKMTDQIFCF